MASCLRIWIAAVGGKLSVGFEMSRIDFGRSRVLLYELLRRYTMLASAPYISARPPELMAGEVAAGGQWASTKMSMPASTPLPPKDRLCRHRAKADCNVTEATDMRRQSVLKAWQGNIGMYLTVYWAFHWLPSAWEGRRQLTVCLPAGSTAWSSIYLA